VFNRVRHTVTKVVGVFVRFRAPLQDPSNAIRNSKDFANANGLTFFNPRAHEGLLRTLMRTSSTGEIMVLIQFFENDKKQRINLRSI
jgi:hypothetical protein